MYISPPEKKTRGRIGFENAQSGGGEAVYIYIYICIYV